MLDQMLECMYSSDVNLEELLGRILILIHNDGALLSCGIIVQMRSQKLLILYCEEGIIHYAFFKKDFKYHVINFLMEMDLNGENDSENNNILKLDKLSNLLLIPVVSTCIKKGYFWIEKYQEASSFFEDERELAYKVALMLSMIISVDAKEKGMHERAGNPAQSSSLQAFDEDGLIFRSPIMQETLKKTYHFSRHDVPVLITGETGTGKEEIAKLIHKRSKRADKPFVIVNCGAIPESIFESELFGHKKGAFTTALFDKRGLIKEAQGGTLFFDEIGDLSMNNQVKILRLVENNEYRYLGDTTLEKSDARFLFATHKNLELMTAQGLFREDLYYRVSAAQIHLPPLRERKEDIPLLFRRFVQKYNEEFGIAPCEIKDSLLRFIGEYQWNGNLREMANLAKQLVLWHDDADYIDCDDLPSHYRIHAIDNVIPFGLSLHEATKNFTREYILMVMNQCKHNKTKASKLLKISRWGLIKLMKRLGTTA